MTSKADNREDANGKLQGRGIDSDDDEKLKILAASEVSTLRRIASKRMA